MAGRSLILCHPGTSRQGACATTILCFSYSLENLRLTRGTNEELKMEPGARKQQQRDGLRSAVRFAHASAHAYQWHAPSTPMKQSAGSGMDSSDAHHDTPFATSPMSPMTAKMSRNANRVPQAIEAFLRRPRCRGQHEDALWQRQRHQAVPSQGNRAPVTNAPVEAAASTRRLPPMYRAQTNVSNLP